MSVHELLGEDKPPKAALSAPHDSVDIAPPIPALDSVIPQPKVDRDANLEPNKQTPVEELDPLERLAEDCKTSDGFIDYNLIYEELQEQFNRAYSLSQKLFVTEKTQRQALYHYKRRVNALLDVLQDLEGVVETDTDQPLLIDHSRLTLLVTWHPELASCIEPALQIAAGTEAPARIPLKRSYAVNLAIEELIPEMSNDELDAVEINPQNTDMWIRRNLLHLIMSKFKPAEVKPKGVREYVDLLPMSSKRKKR